MSHVSGAIASTHNSYDLVKLPRLLDSTPQQIKNYSKKELKILIQEDLRAIHNHFWKPEKKCFSTEQLVAICAAATSKGITPSLFYDYTEPFFEVIWEQDPNLLAIVKADDDALIWYYNGCKDSLWYFLINTSYDNQTQWNECFSEKGWEPITIETAFKNFTGENGLIINDGDQIDEILCHLRENPEVWRGLSKQRVTLLINSCFSDIAITSRIHPLRSDVPPLPIDGIQIDPASLRQPLPEEIDTYTNSFAKWVLEIHHKHPFLSDSNHQKLLERLEQTSSMKREVENPDPLERSPKKQRSGG